jgi:predicted neuraminidase
MKVRDAERRPLLPEGHLRFNNCHASTVLPLPGGDLLVAFFAGTREGAGDTAIWLTRLRNGRWLEPERVLAEAGLAHWNPVLHTDGKRVWLFYKIGGNVHVWQTRCAESDDFGLTWSRPRYLVPDDTLPRGPTRNKLITLSNGEWLAPGSIESEAHWDAFVDGSGDQGRTWNKFDVPLDHERRQTAVSTEVWQGLANDALWENNLDRVFRWDGVIQPTLWESAPGAIHMLLRSTRGHIYRSDSRDFGRTWCPAYATALPNNNSGIDVARLDRGQLALAYNPVAGNWGRRYPISLTFSGDNGASWKSRFDLETEAGEFSYPAVIAEGDVLHLTYTWNRKNIVYRRIVLEDDAATH